MEAPTEVQVPSRATVPANFQPAGISSVAAVIP